MYIYIYTHIHIHICILGGGKLQCRVNRFPKELARMGIHYRGVQWEWGAADGGSII